MRQIQCDWEVHRCWGSGLPENDRPGSIWPIIDLYTNCEDDEQSRVMSQLPLLNFLQNSFFNDLCKTSLSVLHFILLMLFHKVYTQSSKYWKSVLCSLKTHLNFCATSRLGLNQSVMCVVPLLFWASSHVLWVLQIYKVFLGHQSGGVCHFPVWLTKRFCMMMSCNWIPESFFISARSQILRPSTHHWWK